MDIQVDLKGIPEFMAKIKKLDTTAKKLRYARSIYRTSAKPLIQSAKAEAPVLKAYYDGKPQPDPVRNYEKTHNRKGYYESGNLGDSIGFYSTGKGKYYVAPKVGKRATRGKSGFYAAIIHFGTKKITANPFMDRAVKKTGGIVQASLTKHMKKKILAI
jgi:HK97 gp10 family phage protein